MDTVFVRVKVAGDKEKVPEETGKVFRFLGLKGANVEVKSSVYGVKAEGGKPVGF